MNYEKGKLWPGLPLLPGNGQVLLSRNGSFRIGVATIKSSKAFSPGELSVKLYEDRVTSLILLIVKHPLTGIVKIPVNFKEFLPGDREPFLQTKRKYWTFCLIGKEGHILTARGVLIKSLLLDEIHKAALQQIRSTQVLMDLKVPDKLLWERGVEILEKSTKPEDEQRSSSGSVPKDLS